jgi:hypothetical protein
MTNYASNTRNYYLRMPRELHDQAMMSSLLNRRTLKDEILLALTEHLQRQKAQVEAEEKVVVS